MAGLFDRFALNGLEIKNRVMMSPMCQYSVWAKDGAPNEWHYVHYISRAVGGVGLVMMEMTDVVPDGRITVYDLGIWDDAQIPAFRRIVDQVHSYGAKIGIQLAHAGRKAESPELQPEAPSPIAFSDKYRVPRELSRDDIRRLVDAFREGARRALEAGVDTLELHGAHGYLIHQFMSPLSNHRTDEYGEPTRFGVEVIEAVKSVMPSGMPLLMRLSATEYTDQGYSFADLLEMARIYRDHGVDMFDVSTGGNAVVHIHDYPGYQLPYAAELKKALNVPVITVGRMESFDLAQAALERGEADMVAIARGLLRDPYWANAAALHFEQHVQVPQEYYRAFPRWFTTGESR
ncbi:NADH:flavin oxidoreductase/NADH oxidase [Sulfobacillus harzensis]|uniref:NADH:flavin oxidoreductase/NADH oxidase n=1 Tax=Sulfobacillus harzensis TaxID=2729629 RepID=A0A7Y0Q0F1_9FIRM|nr:NADH:flavin oxidoreductase/NADH oxidase [Sulfobacillus harzensis]NMP20958.1 NADH:flavin oxidoreductase/NADH oxidase [Sulfobacillus harzensis]